MEIRYQLSAGRFVIRVHGRVSGSVHGSGIQRIVARRTRIVGIILVDIDAEQSEQLTERLVDPDLLYSYNAAVYERAAFEIVNRHIIGLLDDVRNTFGIVFRFFGNKPEFDAQLGVDQQRVNIGGGDETQQVAHIYEHLDLVSHLFGVITRVFEYSAEIGRACAENGREQSLDHFGEVDRGIVLGELEVDVGVFRRKIHLARKRQVYIMRLHVPGIEVIIVGVQQTARYVAVFVLGTHIIAFVGGDGDFDGAELQLDLDNVLERQIQQEERRSGAAVTVGHLGRTYLYETRRRVVVKEFADVDLRIQIGIDIFGIALDGERRAVQTTYHAVYEIFVIAFADLFVFKLSVEFVQAVFPQSEDKNLMLFLSILLALLVVQRVVVDRVERREQLRGGGNGADGECERLHGRGVRSHTLIVVDIRGIDERVAQVTVESIQSDQ